jgi:hypothetical protein
MNCKRSGEINVKTILPAVKLRPDVSQGGQHNGPRLSRSCIEHGHADLGNRLMCMFRDVTQVVNCVVRNDSIQRSQGQLARQLKYVRKT